MQPRERILVGIIAGLLVLGGGYWLTSGVYTYFADLKQRRDGQRGELDQVEFQLELGLRPAEKLRRWQQQSLPTNLDRAQSHYQNWLLALTASEGVEFSRTNVDSGRSVSRRDIYWELPFTIRGEGDLRQLTTFLYHFYQGNHLHQITHLTVKPLQGSDKLDLTIRIEALSLPGADRTDRLAEGTSDRLAGRPLSDYVESIVERDLFARYRRPSPARDVRPGDPEVDAAQFAYFSGMTNDGAPVAWINVRTTGRVLQLKEGDEFRVSDQKYKVLRIRARAVEIEADGRRLSVGFGHHLGEAIELPTETAARPLAL